MLMMIAIKDDAPNGAAVTPPIAITRARSLPRRRSIGRDALTSTLLGVSFAFDRVSISISAASATFVAAHFAPHRRRAPLFFFFFRRGPVVVSFPSFPGQTFRRFDSLRIAFVLHTRTHTRCLFARLVVFGPTLADMGRTVFILFRLSSLAGRHQRATDSTLTVDDGGFARPIGFIGTAQSMVLARRQVRR